MSSYRAASGIALVGAALMLLVAALIPTASAYVVAYLLSGTFDAAVSAVLVAGIGSAHAAGASITFAVVFTVAIAWNLPTSLNLDVFAGVRAGPYAYRLLQLASPDTGRATIGWFGPLIGFVTVLAFEVTGVPVVDVAALQRVLAGASLPGDGLAILAPLGVRLVAGVAATVVAGLSYRFVMGPDDDDDEPGFVDPE